MGTVPAGSVNLTVKYFRDMLADCTEFQTWTGEPSVAKTLERIYYDGLPLPANRRHYTKGELENYRPFAIVNLAPERGFSRTTVAAHSFDEAGVLEVKLQQTAPESLGDDPSSDANVQWLNSVGEIIDGLCDKAADAAAGHVHFHRIELLGWGWSAPKDIPNYGLFQSAKLRVHF